MGREPGGASVGEVEDPERLRWKLAVVWGKGFQFPEAKEELNVRLQWGSGLGQGLRLALGLTVHWARTTVPELL